MEIGEMLIVIAIFLLVVFVFTYIEEKQSWNYNENKTIRIHRKTGEIQWFINDKWQQ